MRKPIVLTKCVANHYAGLDERIIEFNARSLKDGGGLISFRCWNGKLQVEVYACGKDVEVIDPKAIGSKGVGERTVGHANPKVQANPAR